MVWLAVVKKWDTSVRWPCGKQVLAELLAVEQQRWPLLEAVYL